MARSLVNVGTVSDHWKKYVVLWILAVIGVSVATGFGFWGTLFGAAGLSFAVWGVRSLWRAALARSVEQVAVGSLGDRTTAVELSGRARPIDDPLTAPLSGEACIAYQVRVTETRPEGTE